MAENSLHYFRLFLNRPFWRLFSIEQRFLAAYFLCGSMARGRFLPFTGSGNTTREDGRWRRDGIHRCEMPPVHAQVRHEAGPHSCPLVLW